VRAVVFESEGRLALQERVDPAPGYKEVLIETAAVGICGTDIHVFDGEFEGTVYPLVPGHEATGTVVDHAARNPRTVCGECEFCPNGKQNLCASCNGLGVVAPDGAPHAIMDAKS